MNRISGILLFSLSVLMCSCDSEKEKGPVLPKSYRILHIECEKDNYSQRFEYNEKGLISRWEQRYGKTGEGIESSFEYSDDNSVITVSSDEQISDTQRRVFSETLYLNVNGTAKHAEGNVVIYYTDSYTDYSSELKKRYTVEFKYDSSNQLTDISIAEKRTDFDGWEDQKSLDWCVKIEWQEGNMVAYSEYTSSSRFSLMAKSTYEYYGGNVVEYMPIVRPILRYFYLPLQYQGVLGKRSDSLLKRETISDIYMGEEKISYDLDYSYYFSTTIHDSWVEAFSKVRSYDGEELKYTVGWEAR